MKRDVSEFDVTASEVRASRELFQRLIEDRSWRNSWHRRKVIWAIGVQVKALRTQHQITQEQLAAKAGLDKMTIVRIERPDYRNPPRMNTILQIAAAFDCAFIGKFVPWSRWLRWIIGLETTPFTGFAQREAFAQQETVIPDPAQRELNRAQRRLPPQALVVSGWKTAWTERTVPYIPSLGFRQRQPEA